MKRAILAALVVVIGVVVAARQQVATRPQQAAAVEQRSYRIVFGETDTAGKTWDGSIEISGGEIASLEGWRFAAGDSVDGTRGWKLQTRVGNLEDQRRGTTVVGQPPIQRLIEAGVVARVRGAGAKARVSTAHGDFEFEGVDYGRAAAFFGGNVTVERVPESERLTDGAYQDDFPAAAVARDGSLWTAWLGYRDKADVLLAARRGEPPAVVSGPGDHQQPAIAADGAGRVWVVWSQNVDGVFQLRARRLENGRWGAVETVTSGEGPNVSPAVAVDRAGDLHVAWQGFRQRRAQILLKSFRQGRWSGEVALSEGPGDHWHPAIAADPSGGVWTAWDGYGSGTYQIYARRYSAGRAGALHDVSRNNRFAARPSIACSTSGPWIAWEESGSHWGKDWAVDDPAANKLYTDRSIRAAMLAGNEWREVAATAAGALSDRMRRFHQSPVLAFDSSGRPWMLLRARTSAVNSREDNWANSGRWEFYVTRWETDRWLPAIWLPSSAGRNSMRAALVAGIDNTMRAVWPADQRNFPQGRPDEHDLFTASFPAPRGSVSPPPTRAVAAALAGPPSPHPREADDLRRIRDYRMTLGGKTYRIYRGDLHRHTEFSGDGAGDGSLEDLYRYEINAASLDVGHVGDHQMGGDIEYYWWLTQKSNDLFHVPGRFVPLFGYERSVNYPNGHRNIVWAERGHAVLRIAPAEAKGGADTGPVLYPYLKATGGITMVHTSATQQGTDWRDNDPEVEPLVEIYQGFESNYEHEGAPRWWDPKRSKPVHQGQRPLGYVWNAWAKGYKLGVQASSDHISTHTSYTNIVTEEFTRRALVDAMRRRHTYASTDAIIVDFRMEDPGAGTHLMGDIFETRGQPRIAAKIIGTAPIQKLELVKNNKFILTRAPGTREASFEFVDNEASPGESYYYVRVEQADGELAWSSPIWVRRR